MFSYMMFAYSLAVAVLSPVFSQYLESVTGSTFYVGIFVGICSLVTLLVSLFISKILHKFSRIFLLYIGLLGMAVIFFLFFVVESWVAVLFLQILKGFFVAILFIVIPLMVRDYTNKKTLAVEEGFFYWFVNLAWILGPVVGGCFAYFFGIDFVFLIAAFVLVSSALFLRHKHIFEVADRTDKNTVSILKNLKRFFANYGLRRAYFIDMGLFIWWSIATVCFPLYLVQNGIGEFFVGLFMSLTLIPLIVLEKRIGRTVKDGCLGVNMRRGFVIMFLAILGAAIADNVYFTVLMFTIVSIGAAFIEPLKEIYLFVHMKKSQENDLFPVYSTSRQFGYFVGPAIGGLIISYFGYQVLFFLVGFGLLSMVYVAHLIYKE